MADNKEFVAISVPALSESEAKTHFVHPVYLRNGVCWWIRLTPRNHNKNANPQWPNCQIPYICWGLKLCGYKVINIDRSQCFKLMSLWIGENCFLTYSHISLVTVDKKSNALNILHQATDSLVQTLVSVLLTTSHRSMTAGNFIF